jgi:hypothetical protein
LPFALPKFLFTDALARRLALGGSVLGMTRRRHQWIKHPDESINHD